MPPHSHTPNTAEFLTALTPARSSRETHFLGKVFTKGQDGSLEGKVPPLKWFDARTIPVTSITELHRELVTLATGPTSAALIAGTLSDPSEDQRIRRLKGKTIVDRATRVLVEDRDKFPNPLGLDPRLDGMAAARWMDSFLPPSLRAATASHAWSSSCCVKSGSEVPATLSAAVRRMGNRPMDEAERILLLKGLDRWVRAAMDAAGIDMGKGGIDHRTGFAVQLQYISPPHLPEDMADPLGDERWLILDGEAEVFDVDALLAELAPFIGEADKPPRTKRSRSTPRAAEARAERVVPTLPDDVAAKLRKPEGAMVLPLDVGAVLARRTAILGNRAAFHLHREKCALMQGYARITLDLIEWVRARVAWGKDHSELRAWHVAGGVPEGQRNQFMLALHSCLAYALDGQGTRNRSFRETVTAVAELCVSREWLDKEWWGSGAHKSVTERIHRHGAGETVDWQGEARSPMYSYRPATIRALLGIHEAECTALGLTGLGGRALRLRAKRRLAGHKSRDDISAETTNLVTRAQAMRSEGASISDTAEAVGRSVSWVKKHTIGLTNHQAETRRKLRNSLATSCAPLKEVVDQRGEVLPNSEVGTGNQIPVDFSSGSARAREPRRPGRVDRLADHSLPIPLGPLPSEDWANEGRMCERQKRDAWISGAGVVLRWGLSSVPNGPLVFREAADAVLEPYRAALRAFEAAQAAEARMTAQDRLYADWARSEGRMPNSAMVLPAEPDPRTVPGTQDWWGTTWDKLRRLLRRRDWRQRLEEFRRAEPLAFSVMVLHVPTVEEEAKAVVLEKDIELRRWASKQSKRETVKYSYDRFQRNFMMAIPG